jgi:hypothetical protein
MLRLMLTCHSELVVPPECGFIIWLQPEFGRWDASDFMDEDKVSRFAEAICNARKFDTWKLSKEAVCQAILSNRPDTYANACGCVYMLFASHDGKPQAIWGDKNNYYLGHITALKGLYPGARFIHIVRDGRDVACSYRETMARESDSPYRPKLPISIDEISQRWSCDIRTIQGQLAGLAPEDKLETRYEDLAADPNGELTRICAWLGVPFAEVMLDFYNINRTSMLEPSATMDWKQRTLEPVSSGTVGRFVTHFAAGEAELFAANAGAQLRDYGYLD